MSHEATVWAIRQRGISPAAKLVLWHLADRFHPDHGCFPSQKTLANDCEMSRASLNTQLDALEAGGLIRRESRINEATKRQLPTLYRLACERGFMPVEIDQSGAGTMPQDPVADGAAGGEKPCPESGHGSGEPCPEKPGSRVQLIGHGYIKQEPVSEPVRVEKKKSAGANAGVQTPAPAGGQAPQANGSSPQAVGSSPQASEDGDGGFAAFWADWLDGVPSGVSDSKSRALAAWQGLGLGDRAAARAALARWIDAGRKSRRNWMAPAASVYLSDLMWTNLPAQAGPATGGMVAVTPLSRDWWGVFWHRLALGENTGFMLDQAARPGTAWPGLPEVIAARSAGLVMADRAGPEWVRWRDWLRVHRLRIPETAAGVPVWLPASAPPEGGPGEAIFEQRAAA